MMRSHRAGDLRAGDIGASVVVCGWIASRRDHGGKVFLDVRDAAGFVQVVVDPALEGLEVAHRVRSEWVVRVEGEVRARPEGTVNSDIPTGEVEVDAHALAVLNESEPPPFPLDDRVDVDEVLRLKHRYLDLRRVPMQRNLRLRSEVNRAMREAMADQGFVEVETPMLIASTPEGARDFVVPSRLRPGEFYALPQSPQLFKQLLMVGGFDRYFQIARCLRDEDLRADRQFEFMQLDLEMSFADQQDILDATSHAIRAAVKAVTGEEIGEI
ncbi:MAG TPA: amino acid--tRNA ligase-related protein, partial [Acidimicrobiia bacterium]|nr:amino acid--tRNA ligase-related protein [Acidimicrobiia bacterium]